MLGVDILFSSFEKQEMLTEEEIGHRCSILYTLQMEKKYYLLVHLDMKVDGDLAKRNMMIIVNRT